jgi:hypothetical protein
MIEMRNKKKGVYLVLEDFNQFFHTLSSDPIIINDFNVSTEEDKQKLNRLLYTHYEGDTLETIPACECRNPKLLGGFNIGSVCDICNTEVRPVTERALEPHLWIKAPDGVDKLMNPTAWTMLSKHLTGSGCNVLEWLTKPAYKCPLTADLNKLMDRLAVYVFADGSTYRRSWNYFCAHFDEIIPFLHANRIIRGRIAEKKLLLDWIVQNREKIFCDYIPIPSRLVFITESTPTGIYADTTMAPALDAIRTITSIESSPTPVSQIVRETRTVKAISMLADFYHNFIKKSLGSKPGWFRQHIFGGRPHFTARAVISSLSEPHLYNECHLPWSVATNLLRVHLSKKLLDLGLSPNEINCFLAERINCYDELLDSLFKELIADSPYGGIPIILNRNPTLVRGSIQHFIVTKIKDDPNNNTIALSVLCLAGFNADFDGELIAVLLGNL